MKTINVFDKTQPTIQEKYDFICKHLLIEDVDLFEGDALIGLSKPIYFQFNHNLVSPTVDDAIINAMTIIY